MRAILRNSFVDSRDEKFRSGDGGRFTQNVFNTRTIIFMKKFINEFQFRVNYKIIQIETAKIT